MIGTPQSQQCSGVSVCIVTYELEGEREPPAAASPQPPSPTSQQHSTVAPKYTSNTLSFVVPIFPPAHLPVRRPTHQTGRRAPSSYDDASLRVRVCVLP